MHCSLLRRALPLLILCAPAMAETQVGSWNITISGKVLPSSCDIDSGSAQQNVYIGKFAANRFANPGDVSDDAPLDIKFTGCGENIVGAKVTFSGQQDAANPQLLALSDTGGSGNMASGIGVEVADKNGKAIPVNSASQQYPLAPGDNTLSFLLRYKATQIPVTAGNATAVLYFDVSYQ